VVVSIATDEKGKAMATRGIVAHATHGGELAWCEWLYIIHDDRLEVRRITKDENGNDVAIFEKAHPWESIAIQEATA